MQRIIIESHPAFILLCALVALGYASVLYIRTKRPWSNAINITLFAFRAIVTFFIAFLLLGPVVKQINNRYEKPVYVFVQDNSASIAETTDSVTLKKTETQVMALAEKLRGRNYEVQITDLAGNRIENFDFHGQSSDITGALRKVSNRLEGQNVAGVLLLSDGIYNSGISPLFSTYNFPVSTIGLGDTTQRIDVAIRNVGYNKIVYQGNQYPVQVQVLLKNIDNQPITVSLSQRGKLLEKQTKNAGRDQMLVFDYEVMAADQGIQKLDIAVEVKPGEQNTRNNRASVFVEVVEGRKKILVIAAAPHPDLKALREVIEKNSNYEFLLHIPGVIEQPAASLRPEKTDLAIFYQSPDAGGVTRALFQQFSNAKTSLFLVLGQASDLREVIKQKMPLTMDGYPRDFDEVTPGVNPAFSFFSLSPETNTVLTDFPPVSVHFGKIKPAAGATPLLMQRVGNMVTDKPLLSVSVDDARKIAIMMGEGLWRWRLNEYDRFENTQAFDEFFGKLIQFLSTADDKRKFRSYPIQQEFSDTEPVVFESQVYNDIYEPVYGNTVDIEVTGEGGKKSRYTYVISQGNTRYQVGGLAPGIYRYTSRTVIGKETEQVRGEFAVAEQQRERQNLTADFEILRKLSDATGGKFYNASALPTLEAEFEKSEAKSIIHSEELYDSLINSKWLFFLVIALVTAEWVMRKYHGAY